MEISNNVQSTLPINLESGIPIDHEDIRRIDPGEPLSFESLVAGEGDAEKFTYDLTNISPYEIDDLVNKLRNSPEGEAFSSELLHLATRGAEFLSNLNGSYYGEERLNTKINLTDSVENNLSQARSQGLDTEILEGVLSFIQGYQKGYQTAQRFTNMSERMLAELIHEQDPSTKVSSE